MECSRVRRTVAAVGVILALLALLAWLAPRGPAQGPPAEPTAARPRARPVPVVQSDARAADPVRIDPPPEVQARERVALQVLGDAAGMSVVQCPKPEVSATRSRFGFPRYATVVGSVDGRGSAFTAEQPEGALAVSGEEDGATEVLALLRWRTQPDGTVRCDQEPPEDHAVRVRVVDPDGHPVSAASVEAEDLGATATTDPAGFALLIVPTEAPVPIRAFADPGMSDAVLVLPDAPVVDVPLVLPDPGEDAHAFARRTLEPYGQKRRDLASALATPDLPPDIADILRGWDRTLAQHEASDLADPDAAVSDGDE